MYHDCSISLLVFVLKICTCRSATILNIPRRYNNLLEYIYTCFCCVWMCMCVYVCVSVIVFVCVCVCVCIGGFSGTHTHFISGKWGIQKQWGYPQIQKSLVKQSRGSMHAIGCPLALLESSIFSPVTGRKSYLLCNFFFTNFWSTYCNVSGDIV